MYHCQSIQCDPFLPEKFCNTGKNQDFARLSPSVTIGQIFTKYVPVRIDA